MAHVGVECPPTLPAPLARGAPPLAGAAAAAEPAPEPELEPAAGGDKTKAGVLGGAPCLASPQGAAAARAAVKGAAGLSSAGTGERVEPRGGGGLAPPYICSRVSKFS